MKTPPIFAYLKALGLFILTVMLIGTAVILPIVGFQEAMRTVGYTLAFMGIAAALVPVAKLALWGLQGFFWVIEKSLEAFRGFWRALRGNPH